MQTKYVKVFMIKIEIFYNDNKKMFYNDNKKMFYNDNKKMYYSILQRNASLLPIGSPGRGVNAVS